MAVAAALAYGEAHALFLSLQTLFLFTPCGKSLGRMVEWGTVLQIPQFLLSLSPLCALTPPDHHSSGDPNSEAWPHLGSGHRLVCKALAFPAGAPQTSKHEPPLVFPVPLSVLTLHFPITLANSAHAYLCRFLVSCLHGMKGRSQDDLHSFQGLI